MTTSSASWIETPKIEMNPIAAEIEKFVRVMSSARMPPVQATGIPASTISMSFQFFTDE